MTKRMEVYKCDKCGNIVEMLHEGPAEIICCGQPMMKMEEKTADWKNEKHVPIAEPIEGGLRIKVGSTAHPMTAEHYIEWIEIVNGDYINRKYLKPGDKPEAEFMIPNKAHLLLRSYCNVHGLWKNQL